VYEDDLTNLDEWLRRLKVEYTIYFNGHRKKPPDDLKLRVEKLVKRLSEVQNMNFGERFRYNTLVTRFYVLRDLWRRTLLARELGAEGADGVSGTEGPATPAAGQVRVSIADPEADEIRVRELYQALLNARKRNPAEAAPVAYPQFVKYIAKQVRSIKAKSGCARVIFTIAVDEDAIRFLASPEKPRD
jgi:hypothetical protein